MRVPPIDQWCDETISEGKNRYSLKKKIPHIFSSFHFAAVPYKRRCPWDTSQLWYRRGNPNEPVLQPLTTPAMSVFKQSSPRHVMPEQCQPQTQRVPPCRSPTRQERTREDLLQAPLQSESLKRGWSRSRFTTENPASFL